MKTLLLAALGSMLLGADATPVDDTAKSDKAPRLKFSVDNVDLATVLQGQTSSQVVELSNTGDATLTINRVGVNCGCATLRLSTKSRLNVPIDSRDQGKTNLSIEPGQSASLRLIIDSSKLKAGILKKRCLIFSNDSENSPASLPFEITVTEPTRRAQTGPAAAGPGVPTEIGPATVQPDYSGPPARIEVDRTTHNYGEVLRGEKATTEFTIKSTGEGKLNIARITGTCNCTASKLRVGDQVFDTSQLKTNGLNVQLEPGQEAVLEIELSTEAVPGVKRSSPLKKFVRIYSNDREKNVVSLEIAADMINAIEIEPVSLRLGPVKRGETATGTALIRPTEIDSIEIESIELSNPRLIAAEFSEAGLNEGSPVYNLVVTSLPAERSGFFREYVFLNLKHDRIKQLKVPVHLEVRPDVQFLGNSEQIREFLDFAELTGEEDASVELTIRNDNPDVPYIPTDIKLSVRPASETFSHELVEVEKGVEYKVIVKVTKDFPGHYFNGSLVIRSDHPEARVKVVRLKGLFRRKGD